VLENCQELGGTVAVSSTPGRGTRFVVTFATSATVREPQRLLHAS
jgi:chemotaxis protein histidine kinase CheA